MGDQARGQKAPAPNPGAVTMAPGGRQFVPTSYGPNGLSQVRANASTMPREYRQGGPGNFNAAFYSSMNPAEKVAFSMLSPEQQRAKAMATYNQSWTAAPPAAPHQVSDTSAAMRAQMTPPPTEEPAAGPAATTYPAGYNPFMAQYDPYYDIRFNSTKVDGTFVPNSLFQNGPNGRWIGAADPGEHTTAVPGLEGQRIPFANLRADSRGMWVV